MSERDTERLRDLLHRVVPDAPTPEPGSLVRVGRRLRLRRRLATGGAAVALVAVAAVVAPRVLPADHPAPEIATFDPPYDPVYDAVPCPAELPSTRTSNKTVPDLDRVVGVRLCGDATLFSKNDDFAGPGPSYPASPDGLIDGVPKFAAAARDLPVPDRERCATVDGIASRQALALLLDDGLTVLVGQQFCGDNLLEGHRVDAASVVQAFLGALDTQRDDSSYGVRVDLSCETHPTLSPARPGRERIIAAVECRDGGLPRPVDSDAISRLQDAWADPLAITQELNNHDENTCTELSERPRELLVSTDRGDVVRLYESPCGYLVYGGWRPGESTQIPVTLERLGL